ncbi:DUF4129 domain-containing protein [uncultured Chitinophaga sp.]|uniref:DUF4129 domain-containing protein n=1 Tax=uncultured Chitinophaga sp. TaxID=339340 RepID=UPI0025D92CBE|nr:DUF4129 domain-containing protein [uncultured Chitinophaga sp.]
MKILRNIKRYLVLPIVLLPMAVCAQELEGIEVDTALLSTEERSIMDQDTSTPVYEEVEEEDSEEADAEKTYDTWEALLRDNTNHTLRDTAAPFGETNRPEQISPRNASLEVLRELRKDESLQYEEESKPKPREINSGAWAAFMSRAAGLMVIFFWIFVGLMAILLIWAIYKYISGSDFSFLRSSGTRKKGVKPEDAATEEEEVIIDFEASARKAIAEGNFRQAVRYLYLQTLEQLQEKQLIAVATDKTNADYLREMRSSNWYKPFSMLTLAYEYVWYGQTTINNQQFDDLYGRFMAFKNELR